MTTELAKQETALISLDRYDLLSLMNLDPVRSEWDASIRLNVKLSRIPQTAAAAGDAALPNADLLEELRGHEDELFSWLGKDPENGRAFIANPRAAFRTATGASEELLEKIASVGKGEPPAMTMPGAETGAPADSGTPAAARSQWTTALPLAKDEKTSVLNAGDTVFAGSNGYIYKLSASDGAVTLYAELKTLAGLKSIGHHEVRLAISEDGQKLFVGSYGYAACVRASDFALQWQNEIDGGGDTVNLLVSGKDLYAGTHGHVFKLNDDYGYVVLKNDLKSRGHHEVRLALADDKAWLFVGTDGHALGLSTGNLGTVWETSLKDTRSEPITILTRGQEVYAAGRGRVFKLDFYGNVLASNDLTGHDNHDVRMRFSDDGKSLLLGTDGYALSINASSLLTQWQTDLLGKKGSDVNVLTRGDVVYAGNDGCFIRLTVSTGRVTYIGYLSMMQKQAMGMAMSKNGQHLFFSCNGAVAKTPSAGDLAAGWQAIIATRQSSVNQTLQSLFDAGLIPHGIESDLTLLGAHYAIRADLVSAPLIVDGGSGRVTLQVELKGTVSAGAVKAAMQMSGWVQLTVELEKIELSIQKEHADGFLLSLDLRPGDFFDAIDLSRLTVTLPLMKPFELTDLAGPLLAVMNAAVRRMPFPFQFQIDKPLPAPLNGLQLRLTYTKVPAGAQEDFLSVLFGSVGGGGSFDLAPAIISDRADTAFVFSNGMVMESIKTALDSAEGASAYGFEVSNSYPALLTNAKEVPFNDVDNVWLRIDKGYVEAVIVVGTLFANVSFSYMNVATLGFWHAMHIRTWTRLTPENGNIRATFMSTLDVPWTFFLNILTPFLPFVMAYLKRLLPNLVDGKGDTLIVVPGFDVSSVDLPTYVQIAGKADRDKKAARQLDVAV